MKSLFAKILGGYIVVIVGLALFIPAYSFGVIREYYVGAVTEHLRTLGASVGVDVAILLREHRIKDLNEEVRRLCGELSARITVIDSTGRVMADSETEPATMENHGGRPEVAEALKGGVGIATRYSTTLKEDMLYVARPIVDSGGDLGVVRVSMPLIELRRLLDELKRKILESSVIISLVALVGGLLLARTLTMPIKELRKGCARVASGDFETKVYVKSEDEIKELGSSFNAMSDKIKDLFGQVAEEKKILSGIISSLQEGLVVLDREGRVTLSNDGLARMVRVKELEGRLYWEIIREPKFRELITRVQAQRGAGSEEIDLNGRSYFCSATHVEARDELVVVFHDITEMKKVEKVKRDFVVNVSHELRTPLTAIKGFVETLLDESEGNVKQYAEVVKRNSDRLINIVQDLLVLSEIEEEGIDHALEETDVRAVVENVVRIFKPKAEAKHLTLTVTMETDVVPVKADAFKLEQVFVNLVENAIRYTEKGGVVIRLSRQGERIVVAVRDTGIGIPKEDLPRVFERFYVVDKSRSRQQGGTGLGLAIAKHIVLLHGGSVDVESTLGAGTTFTVFLPVHPA